MKIVYHPLMQRQYDNTPAGARGRLDSAIDLLHSQRDYEFITPNPATQEQLLLAHTSDIIEDIRQETSYYHELLYEMATLAAGGAILAAELAMKGDPVFGLIRPPGHHASRSSNWGFCYFNNIAVSLLNLKMQGQINSAFILDFDLHTGDGNINILGNDSSFTVYNPSGRGDDAYLADTKRALNKSPDVDIIVASAGFDQYINDWGGNLSTQAFYEIGYLMHEFALEKCEGRRYGLLEGGYNFDDLGKNILAFCQGLSGKDIE